jgi:Kef-type K+ transport system membrane component KefB
MHARMNLRILFTVIFVFLSSTIAHAAGDDIGISVQQTTKDLLWIAIILIAAKVSSLIKNLGQPEVLGELLIGVVMGNLFLLGWDVFEPIKTDSIIHFLAEFGVIILLFQIGLDSNIDKMKHVGFSAFLVAVIGVVIPFALGFWFIGPLLLPDESMALHLFLGASLTATSVGITARVFKDLNVLETKEAQIILGAAVIDDVLGLILLAVISAFVVMGSVGLGMIGWIAAKAIIFLLGAIVLGQYFAPKISKFFSLITTGVGMKFTLVISFCLIFSYLSYLAGLAPLVGAFAAGLILDPVYFSYFKDPKIVRDIQEVIREDKPERKEIMLAVIAPHAKRHIQDLISNVGLLFVPIFFVYTGMNVRLDYMFNLPILFTAIGITMIAFIGKMASGMGAGNANKVLVGTGMIPRGEVGLIFAMTGKSLGVISDEMFSIIVIMVILTTLLTPPLLTRMIKKSYPGTQQI